MDRLLLPQLKRHLFIDEGVHPGPDGLNMSPMECTPGVHRASRWSHRLGALLLAALMLVTGCATGTSRGVRSAAPGGGGHFVRLETDQTEPWVFIPPPVSNPVRLSEEDLREALAGLVLEMRLSVRPASAGPKLVLVSAGDAQQMDQWLQYALRGRGLWCQPGQVPREDGCLSLLESGVSMEEYERLQFAVGFALDTVWDAVEEAVKDSINPKVLWAMVGGLLASYVLMLAAPEPVFTKGLALVLTAYMVAWLGVVPFWRLVQASRELVDASRKAHTFAELDAAGRSFGHVVGREGTRIVIMLMMAALGGSQGLAARGHALPGFGWAAQMARTQAGFLLPAVEGVSSITLTTSGGLVIGLAPTAMAMSSQGGGNGHSVYRSLNSQRQVQYVGLTNEMARRHAEHLRQSGFEIQKLLGNLSREDARAVEQALIEMHGLARNGGTLLNRINSIARTNPKYAAMVRRGRELLESIGYKVE